jgi:hypothetical protein
MWGAKVRGGRVGVYQCEAAGDGAPLSSDRVGVSVSTLRRSVGRPATGWRGRREGEALLLDQLDWLRRRRPSGRPRRPSFQIAREGYVGARETI